MITKLHSPERERHFSTSAFTIALSFLLFVTSNVSIAQIVSPVAISACNHVTGQLSEDINYFAINVNNNSSVVSKWNVIITGANYLLNSDDFTSSNGISLIVDTVPDDQGTYTHWISSLEAIQPHQFLTFVYTGGFPDTQAALASTNVQFNCTFDTAQLCNNLGFNFFNEQQFSFGFSVQNNSGLPIPYYEVFIDDATYMLNEDELNSAGFSFTMIDNGNGTYDYIFVNMFPIPAYSSSPTISSNQNLGTNVSSNSQTINCEATIVSSGNDGGLESHGGLASKIALRNFKKSVGIPTAPRFKTDNAIVSAFAPSHILSGDERQESSPTDLIDITAAETIWSGDYYINNQRFGSVFGTKTEHEIYDHTKVICDRVKGSELLSVEVVNIDGYDAIMSVIRRPNEALEYAISFSLAYVDYGQFQFVSNWAIDEYEPSPNFLNYQVWTNSSTKSIKAVQDILKNVVAQNGFELTNSSTETRAPELFATSANYKLGSFYLNLHNELTEPTTLRVKGKCVSKEVDGEQIPFEEELTLLPGQESLEIPLPFGNIFDGEIQILAENSNQKDVIYLADGSWGLEFSEANTTVSTYDIIPEKRVENTNEYIVERGISVAGSTDSYLSIFKQLVPGGLPVDLSAYNTLSFDCESKGVYEVTLLTSDNTDAANNLTHTIEAAAGEEINIPFALFSNTAGDRLDASDVTTIYISFKAGNNEDEEFEMEIENVRFKNDGDSNLSLNPGQLDTYPNPSTGAFSITHLFSEKSDALITIYNANGSIVKQFTETAYKGFQTFGVSVDNQEQGVYLISLQTNEGIFTDTVLIMK